MLDKVQDAWLSLNFRYTMNVYWAACVLFAISGKCLQDTPSLDPEGPAAEGPLRPRQNQRQRKELKSRMRKNFLDNIDPGCGGVELRSLGLTLTAQSPRKNPKILDVPFT